MAEKSVDIAMKRLDKDGLSAEVPLFTVVLKSAGSGLNGLRPQPRLR